MTTTIVHFLVNGRPERAEFRDDCSAAEVKGEAALIADLNACGLY